MDKPYVENVIEKYMAKHGVLIIFKTYDK